MSKKTFDMQSQLRIGELGVSVVKEMLRDVGRIKDFRDNARVQKRGIDLYVEHIGYIEVKTDSHSPKNVFLELEVAGKPGGIDRSCADYIVFLYYRYNVAYVFRRDELQMWLRNNYHTLVAEHPEMYKEILSSSGNNTWSAHGLIVPLKMLTETLWYKRYVTGGGSENVEE